MSEYLRKWESDYKCMSVVDLRTGEFPRNKSGGLDGTDIYIDCANKDMIYDYDSSNGTLVAYFTVKNRGRIILSKLYDLYEKDLSNFQRESITVDEDGIESVKVLTNWAKFMAHIKEKQYPWGYDIEENDEEMIFKFKGNKHIQDIAKLMKARKPFASPSPFNIKNLPSHAIKQKEKREAESKYIKYVTPKGYYDEAKLLFNELVKNGMKVKTVQEVVQAEFSKSQNRDFIQEAEDNNYKFNHYIHFLGLWDTYLKFIRHHYKV